MRKQTWSGVLAAMVFAATVAVAAQAPTSQNSPEPVPTPQPETTAPAPAAPPAQTSESSKITVAGCLQPAPAAPIGTSGTAPSVPPATDSPERSDAASEDMKLVLANAVPAPAEASASSSSSSAPRTYQLIANAEALKPHVGKKLELTGTLEEKDGSPTLRVEAGKVTTEACTP